MWQPILMAISANLDDLGVSFSLGLEKGEINLRSILGIGVISGLTMTAGLLLGNQLENLLPERFEIYISVAVFGGFGLWFIWQGIVEENEKRKKLNGKLKDRLEKEPIKEEPMSWQIIILLGLTLGINSLALGFSGGLQDFPILFTSLFTMATSIIFIWSGTRLGGVLAKGLGKYTNYIAGILLLLIAAAELY